MRGSQATGAIIIMITNAIHIVAVAIVTIDITNKILIFNTFTQKNTVNTNMLDMLYSISPKSSMYSTTKLHDIKLFNNIIQCIYVNHFIFHDYHINQLYTFIIYLIYII